MSNHLEIVTVGDLIWQNGLEYAIEGIRKACDYGVNLSYEIFGNGPQLEAVAFAIHDSQLSNCCTIDLTGKIRKGQKYFNIFLAPAVALTYKFKFNLENTDSFHWIVTSIVEKEDLLIMNENYTLVPRWDSNAIANVLVRRYQRGDY